MKKEGFYQNWLDLVMSLEGLIICILTLPYFYLNSASAIALKIPEILAAQASAQPFNNSCSVSAIASKIAAAQACCSSASGYSA